MSDPAIYLQQAEAVHSDPSAGEAALLRALSEAVTAHRLIDQEIVAEVEAQAVVRSLIWEKRAASKVWEPLPLKSARQEELEEQKRQAKRSMMRLIRRLCGDKMYSRAQIVAIASMDGSASPDCPMDQAIGQADVRAALASLSNEYARRAFWLRLKDCLPDDQVAAHISRPGFIVPAKSITRLVNVALDHVDRCLNAPVVATERARFMNFCLTHGLEFPDYAELRDGQTGASHDD